MSHTQHPRRGSPGPAQIATPAPTSFSARLIVKHIPAYLKPEDLRQHFEQPGRPEGTITDVKVAHKQDGTSRRFGFIGFKTDAEAAAAQRWFDKTFIGSTRISVSAIEGAKDAPAPRPNKRRRVEETTNVNTHSAPRTPVTQPDAKSSDNKLDEFLQVMQPRSATAPSWANEPQPSIPASVTAVDTVMAEPSEDDAPNPEGMSDLDWMRQRMSKKVDETIEEKAFEQSDDEDTERLAPVVAVDETNASKDPTTESILQTSRLFVRNLTFSCTEDELRDLFATYGPISQVHIPLDAVTKNVKGMAYVTFARAQDAVNAYEGLDRRSFQGRLLHILPAVDRKGAISAEGEDGKKRSLKSERAAKRKSTAGQTFNWSMLYMNSDAVASSIADRMNVAKSDILNPEDSGNAAVKLALAETHIIQETKAYLESQGVVLSAFASPARSNTTILVKNIPYGTTEEQIRELFEPHGALNRVIVPPSGTIAVVDFDRPADAKDAFRAVAYRRLGSSVIYLEKGPLDVLTDAPAPAPASAQIHVSSNHAITIPEQATQDDDVSLSAGTTLFVKNLAFSTTAERMNQVFKNLPSFAFARVQTKPDPKKPGARLSMGYGFVGFKDLEGAQKAMTSMQNFNLDGHALHIKFAGRGTENDKPDDSAKSKSRTTKMLVKNIPFEATKKDIRELFGAHGQLKSVRLPKKFDSKTRGFAFLDFASRTEAENAYAALRHTHLLGRHLVLQWAEEGDQDLDALRKKAGVGFGDGKPMPGRKRKLEMESGDPADDDD
ncbi:RNA-binding domain-containing protein [Cylindrobasidium torrendii FP15055 ss-10]|uniref:Multiple RNA-binding domain-containing protein 1 n=1 Tax=Cylindrobasidium torrendii FP15055 ss-10 TaxID=1314674 RepID=A0A0D7BMD0_9AGAR|nr:RNA-binding domain-containing protein [Cylindrobasidium torrendii FP15055 ss-10]